MTKGKKTIYALAVLVLSLVSGVAGGAFTIGQSGQAAKDASIMNSMRIDLAIKQQEKHENDTDKEMDRYAEIIAAQITGLQTSVLGLTSAIGTLNTDVQVLKAIMQRVEEDIKGAESP
jgi:hypothetical protein